MHIAFLFCKRRLPLYTETSSFEFCPGAKDPLTTIQEDFNTLMGQLLGHTVPSLRGNGFVASLTTPTVDGVDPAVLAALATDAQAVELRIDLLQSLDADNVYRQVRIAKRSCAKPVVFCLLPEACGGKFGGSESDFWKLLNVGLRAGCEYIEVQVRPLSLLVGLALRQYKDSRHREPFFGGCILVHLLQCHTVHTRLHMFVCG